MEGWQEGFIKNNERLLLNPESLFTQSSSNGGASGSPSKPSRPGDWSGEALAVWGYNLTA